MNDGDGETYVPLTITVGDLEPMHVAHINRVEMGRRGGVIVVAETLRAVADAFERIALGGT